MNVLLDTDVTIDCLAAIPYTVRLIDVIFRGDVFMSTVVVGEVFQGIHFGRDPEKAEAGFRAFLQDVHIVPFDYEMARLYGMLRGMLMESNRNNGAILPGDADIMIAAVAIKRDFTLVTRNFRHFGVIDGLRLYSFD